MIAADKRQTISGNIFPRDLSIVWIGSSLGGKQFAPIEYRLNNNAVLV